jgi:sulfate/thiosulfate transport system permease protein
LALVTLILKSLLEWKAAREHELAVQAANAQS